MNLELPDMWGSGKESKKRPEEKDQNTYRVSVAPESLLSED